MILRDVAEAVGMHESTISRVTSNKYVHTPARHLRVEVLLQQCHPSATTRADIASESVKQAIKQIIIGGEDSKAPF